MISRSYLILAGDVVGTTTRFGLCQSSYDGIHLIRQQNFPSHTADLLKKGDTRRLDRFLYDAPSIAEMISLITTGIMPLLTDLYPCIDDHNLQEGLQKEIAVVEFKYAARHVRHYVISCQGGLIC